MKNIILALALLVTAITTTAQPTATRTTLLAWDNPNAWADTSNFVFTAFSSANSAQVGKTTAVTNSLPFISLMGNSPNGTYFVNGIAVSTAGLASDNSTNFTFQWLGTIAIQTQPSNLTVRNGEVAIFAVQTAGGAGTVSYQWAKNGSIIPGGTTNPLIIPTARPADNGTYTVACTDTTGTVTSQGATLFVIPKPNPPISIRTAP